MYPIHPIESLVLIVEFSLLLSFQYSSTVLPIPQCLSLPLPLPFFLRVGSGVKADASTALGMTDTTSGFRLALRTVFSLLVQAAHEHHAGEKATTYVRTLVNRSIVGSMLTYIYTLHDLRGSAHSNPHACCIPNSHPQSHTTTSMPWTGTHTHTYIRIARFLHT